MHNYLFFNHDRKISDLVIGGEQGETPNYPTIIADHNNSILGGIEKITGDAYAMELNDEADSPPGDSHKLGTYTEEVDKILDQHNKNTLNNSTDKYEGFKETFKNDIVDERLPKK